MTDERGIPNVLSPNGILPEEPVVDALPSVSYTLVEHLRSRFPNTLPDTTNSSPEAVFGEVRKRAGHQEVIDYLAMLLATQQGDVYELSSSQAEDQPSGSRAPGPRTRG